MNRAMVHRGPDGEGVYDHPHLSMRMRRLSIIDLKGGWQPLYDEEQNLALVANGEIYNFVELREELESRGHAFSTGSDCEVILHLYEELGAGCVERLRGMFAFALWDERLRRLMLARDRMGEKPLYLVRDDARGSLLFASEMKAVLASGLVAFELDPVSLGQYFHYGYVPEPATALRDVVKLDAATLMTVRTASWQIETHRYWNMLDAEPIDADPADTLRRGLEEVSRIVVRSDVPVGVALSGGLDSSAVAALAHRHYPGSVHAFTVGYEGCPETDERAEARAFAEHLGLPHHEIELSSRDFVDSFEHVVRSTDDPIADIAGFSYFSLVRLAREHGVPVLLQGQGGDELFWGYPWVRRAVAATERKQLLTRWRLLALPAYLRPSLPRGLSRWRLQNWLSEWCGLAEGLSDLRRDMTTDRDRMVFYDLSYRYGQAESCVERFYAPAFLREIEERHGGPSVLFSAPHPWPRADLWFTRLICGTYLTGNGITQGDRLSMSASVEMRLPLVDHKFVETVVGLRKVSRDVGMPPKAWLREAVADVIPAWVHGRRKRGFTPPVKQWCDTVVRKYDDLLPRGMLVENGVLCEDRIEEVSKWPTVHVCALLLEIWCRQMQGLMP